MKSILVAAALALPFAAQATPVASFNDHVEHYTKQAVMQSSGSGKAARVAPSFNDNAEIVGQAVQASSDVVVMASRGFNYPAY